MKNATWKSKLLSLLIMLTMLVGMVPLSGIVSFAVEGAADCEHVDNNINGKCDNCDEFLSDPVGEILLGEQRTENIPYNVNGFLYLTFTPSVTGTYEIKALESSGNPFVYVYDSEGNLIVFDDDSAGDFKFHAVCELTAGTTYYIAFSDGGMNNACTFVVTKKCDVHIPEGERNCLGILCAVCGEYYGEAGAHSTTAEGDKAATCASPA